MTSHSDYRLQLIAAQVLDIVVGPEIGAVTMVTGFADGVLTVLTPSSGWLEILEPRTAEFIDHINHALLAPGAITGIQWSVAIPKGATE